MAALALLRQRGMVGLTMSALADGAGISRATLYHYFPDVDAVLTAWVGREIHRTVTALLDEARVIVDPLARLTYMVEVQCRAFASQEHRLSAEHFESEAGSPAVRQEVTAQMAPLRDLLASTITEARASRRLVSDVEPGLGADLILGLLGSVRRRLVAGTLGPEVASAAVMELLGAGWLRSNGASLDGRDP